MTIDMFAASVPVFQRGLAQCAAILAKAEAHAQAKGFDPGILLTSRLAPDMFPLARQIQIAADGARGAAARLAGAALPHPEAPDFAAFNRGFPDGFADEPGGFADLAVRILTAQGYLQGLALQPGQFAGAESRPIAVTMGGRTRHFTGLPFLLHYALPNFHFHIAMAYAILRHGGVPLGKPDFEGPPVYTTAPAGDQA